MKKGISIFLIVLMLFGAILPIGCATAHGNGSDVCLAFIEYIAEGSYGAAFDLLSDSVKNTTGRRHLVRAPVRLPRRTDAVVVNFIVSHLSFGF